ncbi:MAG: sialidase family protein [Gemmatimonadetes bacterium]|nr:sialidase family protein [Gemmatimonadota bacterium]
MRISRTVPIWLGGTMLPLMFGCAPWRAPAASATAATAATAVEPFRTDLAVSGEGAPHYRIPALIVTTAGTVLAAYDARPTLNDLPSNISLVLRRSTDNGRTWGVPIIVRRDTAPNGYGDPSLLVDDSTKRIFLFHAAGVLQGFFGSHTGNDEANPNILQADVSFSDDDGLTWRHRRITNQIKRPAWGGLFASSGAGIQLKRGAHAGRLVQQYVIRINGAVWAASAFSDDHGDSWRMGTPIGPGADENKAVELADGRLMLNSRAKPVRKIAWSNDGGESWSGWRDEPQLTDPANNGAIIRYAPDGAPTARESHWLLFSNTEHPSERRNLVLKLSCDDGSTWPVRTVVDAGPAAYSTIAILRDGALGVLYERGDYATITFVHQPLPRSCPTP